MSEPGFDPGLTDAEWAEKIRRGRAQLAVLPPDRYPCLVAGATAMTAYDPEFHYRFGIDLFIAGVEAVAGADAGAGGVCLVRMRRSWWSSPPVR